MRASLLALGLLVVSSASASPPSGSPAAGQGGSLLRIGLDKRFLHSQILLLSCDGDFTIEDATTGHTLLHGAPGAVFRVAVTPNGLHLVRDLEGEAGALDRADPVSAAAAPNALLKIARLNTNSLPRARIRWRHYRGALTVRREADDSLRVINTVPLEQYLYGVVPAEIGAHVPLEAMKAQAIAARTYALKNRGKLAAEGFDLDDTTRCEGYDGYDGEAPFSNAAVDDTRGLVLTWRGALIDAPYSTDSGGMTACDPSCPYLQAVRDAPPGRSAPDYAADAKYHTWTVTYTSGQLQAALARSPLTQVNALAALTLDGFDASGRVTTATVSGADGAAKSVTGTQLRRILGYDVLRSTRVTLTILPDGEYQFQGKGWGHGLGMSQDGAVAMASPPYRKSYQDILRHYYVGTTLTPLPKAAQVEGRRSAASRPRRGA